VFFQAPTHLAHEIEASQCSYVWAAETHDLPLAVLAAVPVSLLNYVDSCVYQGDREGQLEQKHGMGLVKKTDVNGDAVVMSESCIDKEAINQVTKVL